MDTSMLEVEDKSPTVVAGASTRPSIPSADQVFPMVADRQVTGQKPSFRNIMVGKVMNQGSTIDDLDVEFLKEDTRIILDDALPKNRFSEHVHYSIDNKLARSVIVRLLGKSIGYRVLLIRIEMLWKPMGEMRLTDLDNDYYLGCKIGYSVGFQVGSFQVGSVSGRVHFRSGPFQVGFISGRVRSRSGYFWSGPKQIIGRLIRARVDFKSGSFQVGFISGRIHFRSDSFQVGSISGRFHFRSGNFRSGNFRSISFNVGLIGFRICIKFETLSLVQILDRRRRCLVGWVGIVHRWLLGHFE
ncbi:hypothetical protein GQ457_16G017220 [Hibiscus cannabinus]